LTIISHVLILPDVLITEELVRHLQVLGAKVHIRAGSAEPQAPDALLHFELDGTRAVFVVEVKTRPPYPSEVAALDRTRERLAQLGTPLLLAPYVSVGVGEALSAHGWSWADGQGNFDLRSGTIRLRQRLPRTAATPPRTGLPRAGGGLAVVRALIARPRYFTDPRLTQDRLAAAAGITQARVAQVTAQLREADLVESKLGSSDEDRARLLDAFLDQYAGPGGEETYFYTLEPLRDVAKSLRKPSFAAAWPGAISADVGPDLIAPLRSPTILIVYVKTPGALELEGLVPAEGRADANMIVRAPRDSSVFGSDALPIVRPIDGTSVRLADPAQMIWDLHQLGGEDRVQAADRLRQWVLTSR
jgi:hypothetical protein